MFRNLLKKITDKMFKVQAPISPLGKPLSQPNQVMAVNPTASPMPQDITNKGVPMPNPTVKNTAVPMPTPTPYTENGVMYGRNPSTKIANPTVRKAIESASKHYGVPAALMYDIAMQESSLNPDARNPEPGVTAAGLFQINNPTWDTIYKYGSMKGNTLKLPTNNHMDPETNAYAAAYLIKNGQLGRWDASKNVWGKFWPDNELDNLGFYAQTLKRMKQ